MRRLFSALLYSTAILIASPAHGQVVNYLSTTNAQKPVKDGVNRLPMDCQVGCSNGTTSAFKKRLSTVLTRANDTTGYTGTTTSPQIICLAKSVTACVPMSMTVGATNAVNGYVTAVRLIKNSTGVAGGTFRVLGYQQTPTLTSVFDASVYTPSYADLSGDKFIGYWTCTVSNVNSNNVTYDCTASTADGHQAFTTANATIYFLVETTLSYTPAAQEQFIVDADLTTDVP